MKSIDVCMPNWRAPIYPKVVMSIAGLLKMKYDVNFIMETGFQTAEARNKLVMDSKADYLFFMDSDSVVAPSQLDQLIKDNKDIVTGIYFMRGMPFNPIIYESHWKSGYHFKKEVKEGLERIDGCGMGCCLIKRRVFEKVRKPWFEFNHLGNGSTEDFDFCKKAEREGFKIYADWSVKIGHVGTYTYTHSDWLRVKDTGKNIAKFGIKKRDINAKNTKNKAQKKGS